MTPRWLHRRGSFAREGWQSVVDGAYTRIRIAELAEGDSLAIAADGLERVIVPLAGSFEVAHDEVTRLYGRDSVFAGTTDVLYLPRDTSMQLTGRGRVAIAEAPADESRAWRYIPASETPVELRGAGRSSRQVHNFGTPQALDAARLIVCEVITPAGNWSSYPPHKHDESAPGHESRLEEIYYFEARPVAPSSASEDAAFGLFSAYSSPAGVLEINAMVRTGDIALVPHGYHGPAVAAPDYDLYYLNVMAGPDPERSWLITDDPAHAWVRDTWTHQDVDPRLPYDEKSDDR